MASVDDASLVDDARAGRAVVARASAELENARATLARVKRVFEHGIAARQEVDDAKARAKTTAARRAGRGPRRAAARQVERATVRSPLAGVVVRVLRRPGELVDGTPATPVVEIADPSVLELTADATASDLVRIEKGQTADVVVAALPGATWTGLVAAVSPAVDRTSGLGVVRVTLVLAAASRPPIGVLGTARIEDRTRAAKAGRRAIPGAAVRTGAGTENEVVLCAADGLAHVRSLGRGVRTRRARSRRRA